MTKRYFILANMLLVAVVLYFGVQVAYQFMMMQLNSEVILTQKAKQTDAAETGVHPISWYHAITNLFKTKKILPIPPEPLPIEQTKLQVKLWGTVAGDGIASYAVIEDLKDKKQSLYYVNDKIQSAMVKQILREKVILSLNGKDEVLEIGEKTTTPTSKPISSAAPPAPFGGTDQSQMPPDNRRITK